MKKSINSPPLNSYALKKHPIGVFDSGIGGLSLLKQGMSELPYENWIYLADDAFSPYGEKGANIVQSRALKITDFMLTRGAKAILIACNTATAVSIDFLRLTYPKIPFVGVEPAVKPASMMTKTKVVGVLATGTTTSSVRLANLIERFGGSIKVIVQPCHGLVEIIESGNYETVEAKKLIEKLLNPLIQQGVDTLALGCTHYSFVAKIIQEIVGLDTIVIDTKDSVISELATKLKILNLLSYSSNPVVDFWVTGDEFRQNLLFKKIWAGHPEVKNANLR